MKKTILYIVLAALCPFFKVSAQNNPAQFNQIVTGKVTDEQGQPLPGATVKLKEKPSIVVTTDGTGLFKMQAPPTGTLIISFISYQTTEVKYNNSTSLTIQLKADINSLNEVQVIGYGTTTKRLNTGSVGTVTSTEIDNQPVTNVLSALSGRVAGVFVQTTNGLPGGNINIQIRGKGSILAGTNPLYIVDGVPFSTSIGGNYTASNGSLSSTSVSGYVSPLNSINPDDIESINILKDADATAIYGSRGTNGVVLITTKKGRSGSTKVDVNVNHGTNEAANLPELLSLKDYIQIRHEAFANDGKTPSNDPTSSNYAPDLTVWSQTEGTDWAKYLLGGNGQATNVQTTISGGGNGSNFSLGGNFHSETPYLSGNNFYQREGLHFSFQHTSPNKKFYIQFSNSLVLDNNKLSNLYSASTILTLPPNYPVYNQTGAYNWFYVNPEASNNLTSKSNTTNTIDNVLLQYAILPGLVIKTSAGYNLLNLNQTQLFPASGSYPGSVNYTYFGDNSTSSLIIEPQINFDHHFKSSTINLLAGATYQYAINKGQFVDAENFSSETLMENLSSAATFSPSNSYSQYRYISTFGRATYNLKDKYIINATIRRDGSSRFGSGNQFGTFGSVGGAWLFSEEEFFKSILNFLSFGKLRASYGLTGNDQITDYQYLSTYGSSGYVYQNISGLQPSRIANSNFHWENTRKLDVAIELGFFNNRILLNADYYQNRSDDQLVNYKIPYESGFTSYQANLPAVVQNSGWELELNTKNILNKSFSWTTTFNITAPQNILKSFDNFPTSSYAQTLAIGYDITRISGYKFLGVDPTTGSNTYAAQNGSVSTTPYASATIGKRTPDFYGGIGNAFTYRRWQLDIFGQFAKQMSPGSITYTPGILINNFVSVLDRWQNVGDQSLVPKSSNINDSKYASSSANYFNASYFRVKNISLAYKFSTQWLANAHIQNLRIYMEGQNLFTVWHKNAALVDPESGPLTAITPNLPPVKSLTTGFQLTF